MKRRALLKYLSAVPVGAAVTPYAGFDLLGGQASANARRDYFSELGIRTFINAAGTYTGMTGSLMRPETLEAIQATAHDFCMLDELQEKVGERIARLVKSEAAVVTAGCFSAMTLGLAGILTGEDEKKAEMLPHLEGTGMKTEVICQKGHDIVYLHALKNTGCRIIMVETADEVVRAINERTAMLFFLNVQSDQGKISHEEWVSLGKKHDIPTMIDIAADVPPVENLWKFHEMGFDLVCVSGGKAMRGPQSAGLLMGKKKYIAGARVHMPPRGFNIGRGMKINKEEVIGMYIALEKFISLDHKKEFAQQQAQVDEIIKMISPVSGVRTEVKVPPLGNVTPTLHVFLDPEKIKIKPTEVQSKLRSGSPSIEIAGADEEKFVLTAWMLKPQQEKIVAGRLQEILKGI